MENEEKVVTKEPEGAVSIEAYTKTVEAGPEGSATGKVLTEDPPAGEDALKTTPAKEEEPPAVTEPEEKKETSAAAPEKEPAESADAPEESGDHQEQKEATGESEGEGKPKTPETRRDRRINKITAEKRQAEAQEKINLDRALAAEAELAKRAAAPQPGEPEKVPTEMPKEEDFDDLGKFLDARDTYRDEKRDKAREDKAAHNQAKEAQTTFLNDWQDKCKAAEKVHPDLDEVIGTNVPDHPTVQQAVMESKLGPEIAYHLGKNPEEFERINALPPLSAIREIGKIESTLSSKKEAPPTAPEKTVTDAQVSNAPAPGSKVGSTNIGKKPHDKMSLAEYEEDQKGAIDRSTY